MGKFQLRKPRIISKDFSEDGTHIDNVSKSLQDLVFNYSSQVEKALQKKHLMMMISSLVLVLVIGSFLSPKGKADTVTFYPDTCLGGWVNPRNAEKEIETTSNGDEVQFTEKNSAILYKNTKADIYCGNFSGTFNDATFPKKAIVSFALTNKDITEEVLDKVASTTYLAPEGELASSTLLVSSTTDLIASTTDLVTASSSDGLISTTTNAVDGVATATTSSGVEIVQIATTTETQPEEKQSLIESVVETVSNLFNMTPPGTSDTDTIVIPQEQPAQGNETSQPQPSTQESSPTSFIDSIFNSLFASFVTTVFAQEDVQISTTTNTGQIEVPTEPKEVAPTQQQEEVQISTTTSDGMSSGATTTTDIEATSTDLTATTTSTSTEETTSSPDNQEDERPKQNNFLEIFYTFDGVTWTSLGELNEISMKYRTFEIPFSASSTWSDMSQLQIKITVKDSSLEHPTVYLDGVKVEVVYEGTTEYSHPDFRRDTILKDETVDGMRLVTIINSETGEEEIWYMYLDEEEVTPIASSTIVSASTTLDGFDSASSTQKHASSTKEKEDKGLHNEHASTTEDFATTTDITATTTVTATTSAKITPVIPKQKWFKLDKKIEKLQNSDKEKETVITPKELVEEIKKNDKEEFEEKRKDNRLPDFALDIIQKIRGALNRSVIIQVKKEGKEELWMYDVETGNKEEIQASTTAISIDGGYPVGVKREFLFWLSKDRSTIYAYNVHTKAILEKTVPSFDIARGERARVTYEDFPFEVIIGDKEFTFFSKETGEVFSDDDNSLADSFRKKENLDTILGSDGVSDLNLFVDETIHASATSSSAKNVGATSTTVATSTITQ